MNSWMGHFRTAYGQDIALERVWMKSGGTEMVLNGSIHMTEPYYIYENLYQGRLKKWSHQFSCIVLGYEQQFFTKRAETDFSSVGTTCELQLAACENSLGHVDEAFRPSLDSSALWLLSFMLLFFVSLAS